MTSNNLQSSAQYHPFAFLLVSTWKKDVFVWKILVQCFGRNTTYFRVLLGSKSVLNIFGGFVVFVRDLYFQKPPVAE